MRLVDLLLILLFEGREALPKSVLMNRTSLSGLRKLDSSGERSHRQLIDCIRSKDTDALIEAVDTSKFVTSDLKCILYFGCNMLLNIVCDDFLPPPP